MTITDLSLLHELDSATPRRAMPEHSRQARLYLSPPHMSGDEPALVSSVFESNWIAPLGPQVDAFEREFASAVGSPFAVATSSGTAALHLALLATDVGAGDEVLVSSLTFSASVNPIVYVGATPVLIDSEPGTWNIDPGIVADVIERKARRGRAPRALVAVHLYGQAADIDALRETCDRHGVILIEDAAEALGARYRGRSPGIFGRVGIFSFNGNKIITTAGGGMLVSEDPALAERCRKLATQSREPAPHYEHREVGFNYRLSNVLAAIGRGQLRVLEERVEQRRTVFERYCTQLSGLPGVEFMPEERFGSAESRSTRWLTCLTIEPGEFGATREDVRLALEDENIESRPVWKPMHLQPVFAECEMHGGDTSRWLFEHGLCLPSGSAMSAYDQQRVIDVVLEVAARGAVSS
jgi:dTDP-4-amino-4,6-dideoxygalactose transaminase